MRVLIERQEDGVSLGHSEQFAPVRIEGAHEGIIAARVASFDGKGLIAAQTGAL